MKKLKIAMIGHKKVPSRLGGVEIHVEEISKRLVNKGHSVDVYNRKIYKENEGAYYKGIRIINILTFKNKKIEAIIYALFASIRVLFGRYDIIHYHALGPSTMSFIPRVFGKKVICTIHGLDWQRAKWEGFAKKYLKFGEYAAVNFPLETISVSQTLLPYFKEKYNKDVIYIPNGVYKMEYTKPDKIFKQYGLKKNSYILFVARLTKEKGVHYLIEAYNKLKSNKNLKLVIVGGSEYNKEKEYIDYLKKISSGNKNIIFTGALDYEYLKELYTNAYIYVLPSEIEGLPISLLEAMSSGNLCVTSDIDENSIIIKDYGILFKSKDADDLSKKLDEIIEKDFINMEQFSKERISKYIESEFNWDKIAEETEKVYFKTIKNKKGDEYDKQ